MSSTTSDPSFMSDSAMDPSVVTATQHVTWQIIDSLFTSNPQSLIQHQLESYNTFFRTGIKEILKQNNPLRIIRDADINSNVKCDIYFGGKEGNAVRYEKTPLKSKNKHLFPNEARLLGLTYSVTILYDVELHITPSNNTAIVIHTYKNVVLGEFPIMLMSELCVLHGLDREARFNLGECKNDYGGYFIIDGKEKCIISQERKKANNILYFSNKSDTTYSHSVSIRSVSEDASKPTNTFYLKVAFPPKSPSDSDVHNSDYVSVQAGQIVAILPNAVNKPVPLFILMRALGIVSDEDIIDMCLLNKALYPQYISLFIPSVHDAASFRSQAAALDYISFFTRHQTPLDGWAVLCDNLLPHVGTDNFLDKAYFLGYMVKELLKVVLHEKMPTDRDSFRNKRVELPGVLLRDLFKEYFILQKKQIRRSITSEFTYNSKEYEKDYLSLFILPDPTDPKKKIDNIKNRDAFFLGRPKELKAGKTNKVVEEGIRRAFKGNWGGAVHTQRIGVVQDVTRLSYNSFLTQLRKINLPVSPGVKIGPPLRKLHMSHWGVIDPVDTPDGGNTGLHKHLAIAAVVSSGFSPKELIDWLTAHKYGNTHLMVSHSKCTKRILQVLCKVFVNGNWVGSTDYPNILKRQIVCYRRLGLMPLHLGVYWDIVAQKLYLNTDAGRLLRPVLYLDKKPQGTFKEDTVAVYYYKPGGDYVTSIHDDKDTLREGLSDKTWEQLLTGFYQKKEDYNLSANKVYKHVQDLYPKVGEVDNWKALRKLWPDRAVLEYLDSMESEGTLIAMDSSHLLQEHKPYTHMELHPSLIFGVMGNQVIFPEHNELPRDLFSCAQSCQAISVYHTNFSHRVDKSASILHSGQVPLVKSRFLDYINKEENVCGENAIVAIMCYNGYNVEDSILFNEGAIKRGLFNSTAYTTYDTQEEQITNDPTALAQTTDTVNSIICNVTKETHHVLLRKDASYTFLDETGLIKENSPVTEDTVLIGKMYYESTESRNVDDSVLPKKGQEGFCDKVYLTTGGNGYRKATVRVREERIPAPGDKFCSRCGQKGTVGLIIPEEEMPFTAEGMRPDIIINPHAFPSRRTVGQLIECVMAKACALFGAFGDATAFESGGEVRREVFFGNLLHDISYKDPLYPSVQKNVHSGYHSSGNEIMYNGATGEQLEAAIFMGPTFYMRLKHMPKDKINYRDTGPRTLLTRQVVQGRANDGGIRIGEMERDALAAHGISHFLNESMMVRGDQSYMAICNRTGTIAIYNESYNLFLSPIIDGKLEWHKEGSQSLKKCLEECKKIYIENVSKFGYNFSVIRVPYAFKLLMQELTTMNVQMRLITEDNINKMVNMQESPTLQRLSGHTLHEWLAQSKDEVMMSPLMYKNDKESTDRDSTDRDSTADDDFNKGSPIYKVPVAEGSAAEGSAAEDIQGPQTPPYISKSPSVPLIAGAPALNTIFALDELPTDPVADAQQLQSSEIKEVTI